MRIQNALYRSFCFFILILFLLVLFLLHLQSLPHTRPQTYSTSAAAASSYAARDNASPHILAAFRLFLAIR